MDSTYQITNISRQYGKKKILTDINITARRGECIGIAGRNGIGKSTLFKVLAGIDKPTSGTLTLFGHDLIREPAYFGQYIGYVPQTNPLLEELSAADNLRLWSKSKLTKEDETIRALELDELLKMRVSKMSGGMKRRLAIACALAQKPPVMIMDEPTSALDLYHKGIIYDYLRSFRDAGGLIILSTHDMEEMEICDRIYLIHDGIAEEMPAEEAAAHIRAGEM